jgi:hypothetical protein
MEETLTSVCRVMFMHKYYFRHNIYTHSRVIIKRGIYANANETKKCTLDDANEENMSQ